MSEIGERVLEQAHRLLEKEARKTAVGHPNTTVPPNDQLMAWAALDLIQKRKDAEAREEIEDDLSRAVGFLLDAFFDPDDASQTNPEEVLKRIATPFIHAQNATLDKGLRGFYLWNTTEAIRLSERVGAHERGGGLQGVPA